MSTSSYRVPFFVRWVAGVVGGLIGLGLWALLWTAFTQSLADNVRAALAGNLPFVLICVISALALVLAAGGLLSIAATSVLSMLERKR